jgi:hypothetical protein
MPFFFSSSALRFQTVGFSDFGRALAQGRAIGAAKAIFDHEWLPNRREEPADDVRRSARARETM